MNIAAVICEYNPFHMGHLRQIRKIREAYGADTVVLALMSGNYVQRGEPAIVSKYDRAQCAVACGADVVLELPYPWSCSGASFFAQGAVGILNALGCVDELVFGCEEMTLSELQTYAERIAHTAFTSALRRARQTEAGSLSDIRLRQAVYGEMFGGPTPRKPNDILAAEYLLALRAANSPIQPYAIPRRGEWSATAIRRALAAGEPCDDQMPALSSAVLQRASRTDNARFMTAVLGYLRMTPWQTYAACDGAGGGFAKRIFTAAQKSATSDELLSHLRCKSHTDAAIRRTVLHCVFGTDRHCLKKPPCYTVLLAANARGMAYLHRVRKDCAIPVLTKPSAYKTLGADAVLQGERSARADSLFALAHGNDGGAQLRRSPYIKKG